MRSKLISALTVIGAVTVLVLAANTVALATTGKALIAGKSNTSSKVTTIKRTKAGPVAKLTTKSSANAPLVVNGKGKVANLNADKVDGLDGGTQAYRWIATGNMGGSKTLKLTGLPVGNYLVAWEAYILGGDAGSTGDCYIFVNEKNLGSTYRYTAESSSLRGAYGASALSGAGFVTVTPSDSVGITCRVSSGTWTADARQPLRVTAVPLAGVSGKPFAKTAARGR